MRFIKSNQQVNSISLRAITGAGFEVLRNYPSCSLRLERICVWLSQATQTLPGPVSARAKDSVADIEPGHKPMSRMPSAASDPQGMRTADCLPSGYSTAGTSPAIFGIGLS